MGYWAKYDLRMKWYLEKQILTSFYLKQNRPFISFLYTSTGAKSSLDE